MVAIVGEGGGWVGVGGGGGFGGELGEEDSQLGVGLFVACELAGWGGGVGGWGGRVEGGGFVVWCWLRGLVLGGLRRAPPPAHALEFVVGYGPCDWLYLRDGVFPMVDATGIG